MSRSIEHAQEPARGRVQTILVVEDDPITARYLELALKRMGHALLPTASSSEGALDLVAAEPPDLVLMDIQIEGARDGVDTARLLRDKFDVPVIFLTGLADETTMQRARDADPLDYLIKPVKAEDLRTALVAAFQKESLARIMRDRECWFVAAMEAVEEAVVVCNLHGEGGFANSAGRQLLGLAPEAPVTMPKNLMDGDGQRIRDFNALPGGETLGVLLRDIGDVSLRLQVRHVTDVRGRALGCVVVLRLLDDNSELQVELRRLRGELELQSLTDELTGLHNRRGLNVLADQQLKLMRRGRAGATLLLIALTGMKEINDLHGREAGDQALRDLAAVLRETFRESDLLSRVGGGEFAVFANTGDATDYIVRLHANVAASNAVTARTWKLRIAVGIAVHHPKNPQRITELMAAAEQALRAESAAA